MGETQSATEAPNPLHGGEPRRGTDDACTPVRVGAAAQVSDHWQVVATFEVRLATDDYTILELELEGDQIAKKETRGLGIGQIVIGP